MGRFTLFALLAAALAAGSVVYVRRAYAAPYANPFWVNVSPSPESPVPSVAGLAITPEGVDVKLEELFVDDPQLVEPGMLGAMTSDYLEHWRLIGGQQTKAHLRRTHRMLRAMGEGEDPRLLWPRRCDSRETPWFGTLPILASIGWQADVVAKRARRSGWLR